MGIMGMCTTCGGVTHLHEDLGIIVCENCGAEFNHPLD